MRASLSAALALTILAVPGCASDWTPQLGSEKSFDGLVRVENERASAAWIDPDLDLSGYRKVKLEKAGIQYRPAGDIAATGPRATRHQVQLTSEQKEILRDIMSAEFLSELGRSERFELTDGSGPDVLIVRAELLDVVAYAPAGGMRGTVALRSVGEVTLVVELRDSTSGKTLARLVDRRAAQRADSSFVSKTATGEEEVQRLAASWARLLRRRIDQLPTLSGGEVAN
ncbi:MAG: DUF3313 family protein [Myxococcota bacterium]|nr:DUF3313 family protein [Myxococcota bacterium]